MRWVRLSLKQPPEPEILPNPIFRNINTGYSYRGYFTTGKWRVNGWAGREDRFEWLDEGSVSEEEMKKITERLKNLDPSIFPDDLFGKHEGVTPRDVMAIIEDAYLENVWHQEGYNAFMKECSYKIEQLFNQKT